MRCFAAHPKAILLFKNFFDDPKMGEAEDAEGGMLERLEKNPQQPAQGRAGGDDVIVGAKEDVALYNLYW